MREPFASITLNDMTDKGLAYFLYMVFEIGYRSRTGLGLGSAHKNKDGCPIYFDETSLRKQVITFYTLMTIDGNQYGNSIDIRFKSMSPDQVRERVNNVLKIIAEEINAE